MANIALELQQEQPQFYSSLSGHLSAEEQNVLQTIVVKADEIAAQQAQQAPANGGAN
jgi:hypothetical protein